MNSQPTSWQTPFLKPPSHLSQNTARALIILNQPFSAPLFSRLWASSTWKCCADGGANRLYDLLHSQEFVTNDPGSL